MRCSNNENINCTCTHTSCSRYGVCCECVSYHRENNEIPGCFFSKEDEKTYNRSMEFFMKSKKK